MGAQKLTKVFDRIRHYFPMLRRPCRVDDGFNFRDLVGGEAALLGVFADQVRTRRCINAIDLIVSYVAVDPLNVVSKFMQHAARFCRRSAQLVR